MTIKLTVLGSGSAFNFAAGNTAYLIETGEATVLIDCGFTVPQKLMELGKLEAVTHIFISHTHADHIGGLEPLAQYRYFVSQEHGIPVPKLCVSGEILERLRSLEKLGLANIQDNWGRPVTATLETYFDGIYRNSMGSTRIPVAAAEVELDIQPFRVNHVPGSFPSHGFEVIIGDSRGDDYVQDWHFLTCDTKEPLNLQYRNLRTPPKLVFHDCQLFKGPNDGAGDVHANIYDLAAKLSPGVKAKTWLVHYGSNLNAAWEKSAADYGFAGFAKPGQEFILAE